MLVRNAQGNLEDVTPVRQGQETDLGAEARVLMQQIRWIKNNSDNPEARLLAEAILKIGALVYAGR